MVTAARKTPQRTCVACGNCDAKKGLIRFVRGKDGTVQCDESGRIPGRGAYLCAEEGCFRSAEKQRRLERALRCRLQEEDYRHLEEMFHEICLKRGQTI